MADYSKQMWAGLDPKRREAFARATTLNTTEAGAKLVQNLTNRIIQELSLRHYGILGVMDTRPGQGQSALVNRRTGSANNDWVGDAPGDVTAAVGGYSRTSFDYKTMVGRGIISRKLQATGRAYIDIMAEEMMQKLEDFNESLDLGLLIGDPLAASGWFNDADSTQGFFTACNTYGASATETGSQTVFNDEGGATLTDGAVLNLQNLDKAIDLVKGSANRNDLVIVGSYGGVRALNKALTSRQIFNDTVEVAAGFRVRTYDGIPVIPDTNMGDLWSYVTAKGTGSTTTYLKANTGGASTNLLILNKRLNWIEELTPTTVMPLSKTTSQEDSFDIFWDGAAVAANPLGASMIFGITPG